MIVLEFLLGALLVIAALLIFALAPGRYRGTMDRAFQNLNCAHRGLHTKDQSVPENSLAAFAAAREAGYGVELDVQLSRDGEVVVFHDDDLLRACGIDAQVDAFDWDTLRTTKLFDTTQCIPLFTDVLKTLGEAPVIVELKTGSRNPELCRKTLEILRAHNGPWCIESFDPRVVAWFRKNAPDVLRGQLSAPAKGFDTLSPVTAFALGNLLTNVLARPHFVAYDTSPQSLLVKICMALRPFKVVWTVRPDNNIETLQRKNDCVIFEYYDPAPRY